MSEKLVTIAEFADYIQADLARQLLEDFDIKAVVTGQYTTNLFSGIEGSILQVMESQAAEAIEILESNKNLEPNQLSDMDDDIEQEEQ
jgi:chemotaxis protein CheY-P-specific phosphatase CheC